MARIIWSTGARLDLETHLKWIADKATVSIALKWAAKFRASIESLEQFPEIGAPVEELPFPGLRERLVGHYRIIYRYDGADCHIYRIVRAERDLLRVLSLDDFRT